MKQSNRCVLLANGSLLEPEYCRTLLREDDFIIAANGGTRHSWTLQRLPDLVIGDADSLPYTLQGWLAKNQVPHQRHPPEKDATDLELALHHALTLNPKQLLLLGLTGHRLDHTLANFATLALTDAAVQVEVVAGYEHIYLVQHAITLCGEPGQLVSLIPWGGDAVGVETQGLKWELRGDRLPFAGARGISNVLVRSEAKVSLEMGLLLVCHHKGEAKEPTPQGM